MPIYLEISPLHRLVTIVARGTVNGPEVRASAQKLADAKVRRFAKIVEIASAAFDFTPEDIATGFRWFGRHGAKVVFFGRLIPVVRSVVSIPAGAERMPFWRFTALTALGSLLWNTVWIWVGNLLGDRWHEADEWHGVVNNVVMAAMVLGFGYLVFRARRRNRATALALADEEA